MSNYNKRQYQRAVRQEICFLLDIQRENGSLTREQEEQLKRLGKRLDFSTEAKYEEVCLDFKELTVEKYLELREFDYTLKQISRMYGISLNRLYKWRKENQLINTRKKENQSVKEIQNEKISERVFPFIFDFSSFTEREYQSLRNYGYTDKEIEQMCQNVSHEEFLEWKRIRKLDNVF
ncbi:hypothetical protein ACVTYA_05800 [Enterococcus hirae]